MNPVEIYLSPRDQTGKRELNETEKKYELTPVGSGTGILDMRRRLS